MALLILLAGFALLQLRSGPHSSLVVSLSPSVEGKITIDGKPAGRPGETLNASVGTHSIGIEADGWTATPRRILLTANMRRSLTLFLAPRPASLALRLHPSDAAVRVDGRLVDAGQGRLSLAPGRHWLNATHPGFIARSLPLVLKPGEKRVVSIMLAAPQMQVLVLQAPVGIWSEPIALPPHADFTLALSGRVRLRVGRQVYLVASGSTKNLGDVNAGFLQVKAVGQQPIRIRLFLRPRG